MARHDFYGMLYRAALFPFYDRAIKRRTIHRSLGEISKNPWIPLPELREIQRKKLQALLGHCGRHVPYYRRLFDETGLDVGKSIDMDDVRARGIFTSKEIIRSAGADLRSDAFLPGELHRKVSSGSTGTPIRLHVTLDYWCLQMATKYRAESWIGKAIGAPTTYVWGHRLDLDSLARLKVSLYWRLQNYQFVSAFDVGEEALLADIGRIRRFGPRFIEAYVSPVYLMARLIEERGIEPPRPDGIVTGGEIALRFPARADRTELSVPRLQPVRELGIHERRARMLGASRDAHQRGRIHRRDARRRGAARRRRRRGCRHHRPEQLRHPARQVPDRRPRRPERPGLLLRTDLPDAREDRRGGSRTR